YGAIVVSSVGRFWRPGFPRDAAPFGAVEGSGLGGADWLGRQRVLELMTRADAQLAEDLVQVVLHRAAADEQPRGDVRVRDALTGEACDLGLLNSQVVPGLNGAFADSLAGGQQLPLGALGERSRPHVGE